MPYHIAGIDVHKKMLAVAPNAAILPNRRFSCPFTGRQAQLQPVAEIVQCGEPIPKLEAYRSTYFAGTSTTWLRKGVSRYSPGSDRACREWTRVRAQSEAQFPTSDLPVGFPPR